MPPHDAAMGVDSSIVRDEWQPEMGPGFPDFVATDVATTIAGEVTIDRSLAGPAGSVVVDTGAPMRQVGRYRLLENLHKGATATVYRAYDPGIDRPLVIKLLHAELCCDSKYRTRFLREAGIAGMLSHPNIATTLETGEVAGCPYIAMELVEGRPLSESLANDQVPALRDVISIGIELASALDHMHSRGIVHRDVKPGNIIRLADSGMIKLIDFGIAEQPSASASAPRWSDAEIGTPHYMSPEQIAGGRIDARADLWAVGVILYQMISGRRPFEASTRASLFHRIASDSPQPVAQLREAVPASLRRITACCLDKQPEKRFQSGKKLAVALARARGEIDAKKSVRRR